MEARVAVFQNGTVVSELKPRVKILLAPRIVIS